MAILSSCCDIMALLGYSFSELLSAQSTQARLSMGGRKRHTPRPYQYKPADALKAHFFFFQMKISLTVDMKVRDIAAKASRSSRMCSGHGQETCQIHSGPFEVLLSSGLASRYARCKVLLVSMRTGSPHMALVVGCPAIEK